MTNYPEKCHVNGCPCHEFSAKSPSETYYGHPRLDTGANLAVGGAGTPPPDPQHPFQPSEGLNPQETQNRAISTNGHVLYTEQNCSVFHDSDKQCPVHEGGLAVCRLCGEYEAGLDQPCRKVTESQKPTKYSPVIEQAFRCWNEHRAYVDDDDNYRVKRHGSIRGPIASWNRAVKELFPSYREFHAAATEFENALESIALRNTRSILHHAELVEEQKQREVRQRILDALAADRAINALGSNVERERLTTPSSFDDAWNSAPESMRRVTEIEAAELFYYAGRRDRETEMLREVNEVLSGVVRRIEQERVR